MQYLKTKFSLKSFTAVSQLSDVLGVIVSPVKSLWLNFYDFENISASNIPLHWFNVERVTITIV